MKATNGILAYSNITRLARQLWSTGDPQTVALQSPTVFHAFSFGFSTMSMQNLYKTNVYEKMPEAKKIYKIICEV